MVIISIPRRWRPHMGAGRLWHMVGTTSALYRCGAAPLWALGATSGRYNAPPMCHVPGYSREPGFPHEFKKTTTTKKKNIK